MLHLRRYIWAGILGSIILGVILPGPGLLLNPSLGYLLIALMTFSCLNIKPSNIKKAFFHTEIYLVVLITLIVTPLMSLIAKPFIDSMAFAGLVLATAIPAGVSIVFISELLKGKPVDALSITTLSHILSIVTVPILLTLMAGKTVNLNTVNIFWALIKFVIIPLALAQILRPILSNYKKAIFIASTILLLLIIWGIIASVSLFLVMDFKQILVISGVVALCMMLSFLLGWLIGRNRKEKITYSMSASYKNFSLSTVIALSIFGEAGALASISYTILNNILFAIVDWLAGK